MHINLSRVIIDNKLRRLSPSRCLRGFDASRTVTPTGLWRGSEAETPNFVSVAFWGRLRLMYSTSASSS
jgi:hypothetical protein